MVSRQIEIQVVRYLTLVIALVPLMWLGVKTLIGWEQTCCGEKWKHLAEDPSYVEVSLQEALKAGYPSDVELPCYRGPISQSLQLAISATLALLPLLGYWIILDLARVVQVMKQLVKTIRAK